MELQGESEGAEGERESVEGELAAARRQREVEKVVVEEVAEEEAEVEVEEGRTKGTGKIAEV